MEQVPEEEAGALKTVARVGRVGSLSEYPLRTQPCSDDADPRILEA